MTIMEDIQVPAAANVNNVSWSRRNTLRATSPSANIRTEAAQWGFAAVWCKI